MRHPRACKHMITMTATHTNTHTHRKKRGCVPPSHCNTEGEDEGKDNNERLRGGEGEQEGRAPLINQKKNMQAPVCLVMDSG